MRALLKCKYDKADDHIYARLESYQPTAMKNARRLEKYWVEMGKSLDAREREPLNQHS